MNIFKTLGLILLFIFCIAIILLVASAISHYYQLRKEAKAYPPPGKMVEVNNHKIHVFGEGQGDITLVFLPGHGTSCPTIDFKPLWMRLVDEYRVAVVEREPYILVPHSMAGLEAIYWAQTFPHEVKAIIGLDPPVPDFVEQSLKLPQKTNLYLYVLRQAGLECKVQKERKSSLHAVS